MNIITTINSGTKNEHDRATGSKRDQLHPLETARGSPLVCSTMGPFRTSRLVVNFPSGKRIIMMWNKSDSVAYIKSAIENKMGIPTRNQVLHWSGAAAPLQDNRTLTSYNIRDEAHINVEVLLEDGSKEHMNYDNLHDELGFKIWVQTIGGQNVAVVINNTDSTDFLKLRILKWTGIPPNRQRLIFGDELRDGVLLNTYGLHPGATVKMAVSDDDWEAFSFQTFVRLPNGNLQVIRLSSSDPVAYVKSWIGSLSGLELRDLRLLSGRYELMEGYTLGDYNIKGTIHLTALERNRGGAQHAEATSSPTSSQRPLTGSGAALATVGAISSASSSSAATSSATITQRPLTGSGAAVEYVGAISSASSSSAATAFQDDIKELHKRINDVIATSRVEADRITQSINMAIFNMENDADERFDTVFDSLDHVQVRLRA